MIEDEFLLFRQFILKDEALALVKKLDEGGIEAIFGDNKAPFDVTFESADLLIAGSSDEAIHDLPNDYYLYSFTIDALYHILARYDEWGEIDLALAKKILTERGENIDDELIRIYKEKRLAQLAKPEKVNKSWLILSYFLALTGIYGIAFGHIIYSSNKTLPDGKVLPTYTENDAKEENHLLYWIISLHYFPINEDF
ncbi:MAG: hypothetical protein IPI15_17220 [Saprospiraceae bacterium]|uniref:hypothetical protein n=1 Tax=Candidatus Brachybacter algidus TaxID=2982024 RepID=UPI00257F83B2|nr:hypothetical protein [Candidatus Brachybacter algidus]MBK7605273.1 hypothetical protein [Candidatus Brachybacter algidus]